MKAFNNNRFAWVLTGVERAPLHSAVVPHRPIAPGPGLSSSSSPIAPAPCTGFLPLQERRVWGQGRWDCGRRVAPPPDDEERWD